MKKRLNNAKNIDTKASVAKMSSRQNVFPPKCLAVITFWHQMYLRKNDGAVPKRIGTIASPCQEVCDKTMRINYNTKEQKIEKIID